MSDDKEERSLGFLKTTLMGAVLVVVPEVVVPLVVDPTIIPSAAVSRRLRVLAEGFLLLHVVLE